MAFSDVNNVASTKSGLDWTGSDWIGLFISVADFTLFSMIWSSVFVKNSNRFSKFFLVCLQSA